MKNVFLYQFKSDEIKEKFKVQCRINGRTMHDQITAMVDVFLGLEAEREKQEVGKMEEEKVVADKLEAERIENENEVKNQYKFKNLEFNKFRTKPEELEKWNNENPDKMIIISAEDRKDFEDREKWEESLTWDERMAMASGKLSYPDRLKV